MLAHDTSARLRLSPRMDGLGRWYYQARAADHDPVRALTRRPRADAGRARAMSAALLEALLEALRAHLDPVCRGLWRC